MGFPVRTWCYPGDFQNVKGLGVFGFISGISQDPISSFSGLDPKFLYTEAKAWGNNSCRSFTKTEAHPPLHSQGHPMTVGRKKSRRVGDSQAQSNILPVEPAHQPPGLSLGSALPKTLLSAGKAQLLPQSTGAQGCHARPPTSQVHRNVRGRQSQECSLTSPGLDILTESLTTGGLSSALRPSL